MVSIRLIFRHYYFLFYYIYIYISEMENIVFTYFKMIIIHLIVLARRKKMFVPLLYNIGTIRINVRGIQKMIARYKNMLLTCVICRHHFPYFPTFYHMNIMFCTLKSKNTMF